MRAPVNPELSQEMHPKSAADIFEALPKKSVDFVFDEIKGTNKEAKRKLLKAKNECKIETKSFEDADIDLLTFDWVSIDMDRNWWWQLQALPFLGWFAQSYKLFEPEEQQALLIYCLEATEQWIRQEDKTDQSPLRWHDHATAYRLTNFVHCLVAASTNSQLIQVIFDHEKLVPFADIISHHVKWLMRDENYSKHTNHGFDQAMAVLTLGLLVEKKYWSEEVQLAESRLVDEVRFAFTEEGVHKENSPGYHVFMMRRLEKLVRLERLGETTVGTEARKIQEGAERFLEAITLPDGTLPMVGDTRGGQEGIKTPVLDGPVIHDFSKSGYVIIKGLYKEKEYYILFKNTHASNYHRHDDDLSVYIYYNGVTVLGDGGLGSHNEKDAKRKQLRSYSAHNVPYLENRAAVRNIRHLVSGPTISVLEGSVLGVSCMFGQRISRSVDFSRIQNGQVSIYDSLVDGVDNAILKSNFITPCRVSKKESDEGVVLLLGDGCKLSVKSSGGKLGSIDSRYLSEVYGSFESATGFNLLSAGVNKINFCIEFT